MITIELLIIGFIFADDTILVPRAGSILQGITSKLYNGYLTL